MCTWPEPFLPPSFRLQTERGCRDIFRGYRRRWVVSSSFSHEFGMGHGYLKSAPDRRACHRSGQRRLRTRLRFLHRRSFLSRTDIQIAAGPCLRPRLPSAHTAGPVAGAGFLGVRGAAAERDLPGGGGRVEVGRGGPEGAGCAWAVREGGWVDGRVRRGHGQVHDGLFMIDRERAQGNSGGRVKWKPAH
jgi:hypothetical protein